jgi:hypothetical protein
MYAYDETVKVKLVGHAARMGETRNVHKISVGKPTNLEDLGIDGGTIVNNSMRVQIIVAQDTA